MLKSGMIVTSHSHNTIARPHLIAPHYSADCAMAVSNMTVCLLINDSHNIIFSFSLFHTLCMIGKPPERFESSQVDLFGFLHCM